MLVAALAVAVLRATALRMALAAVAVLALGAVKGFGMAAVGLGGWAAAALGTGFHRRLEALERLGAGLEVGRQRHPRQALARGPLDIAQIAALVRRAEG